MKRQLEEKTANTSNADIDLIKNLVIGYISAPNANAKNQILKLISNVLNLNDTECMKIGLKSGSETSTGWFSRSTSDNLNNNVSLAESFVAFLEKESQPRVNANLLTIHENETTMAVRKNSESGTAKESTNSNNNNSSSSSNSNNEENPAPIMLGENSLLTPYNNRNSSSILKDILYS
jgi:thyroid receptor-interacting protein 11